MITKGQVSDALRTCKDPELGYNVVDLGLIYDIQIKPDNAVFVKMTLTTPGCPLIDEFLDDVHRKLKAIPGVGQVKVDLTFDPPWSPEKLSPEVKAELGLD